MRMTKDRNSLHVLASAIVLTVLCLILAYCYAKDAAADSMLGNSFEPSKNFGMPAPPPTRPEKWSIMSVAVINGKVDSAVPYNSAVYPAEPACTDALTTDVKLDALAARTVTALQKVKPGAKVAVVFVCAMELE